MCVRGRCRASPHPDGRGRQRAGLPLGGGCLDPHTCLQGYVRREAYPGDDVCVTGAVRAQAAADNAQTAARVLRTTG